MKIKSLIILSTLMTSQAFAGGFNEKTLSNVKDKLFVAEREDCPAAFKLKELEGTKPSLKNYAIISYTKDKQGNYQEDGFEVWKDIKPGADKPIKEKAKLSKEIAVTKISSVSSFGDTTIFNVDYDFKGTKGDIKGEKAGLGGAWSFNLTGDNTLSYAAVKKQNVGKIGIGSGKMCNYKLSDGSQEIAQHDGERSSGKDVSSEERTPSDSKSKNSTAQ